MNNFLLSNLDSGRTDLDTPPWLEAKSVSFLLRILNIIGDMKTTVSKKVPRFFPKNSDVMGPGTSKSSLGSKNR